jgi:hypothetical protein
MKDSKALYAGMTHDGFQMIVWKTDLGLITTVQGKLDPTSDLIIKNVETGEIVSDVDLRNVLMSILPIKTREE